MNASSTREKARIPVSLLAGAATLLFGVSVASAELTPWDQEKVTAIAGELVEATNDLRGAVRRQPPPTLGQPGRAALHRIRDELSAIESTARRLHNALSGGAGMEETLPTFQRLIRSVRSVSEDLPRVSLGEQVTTRIEAAAAVLRRLRPYYEEAPLV